MKKLTILSLLAFCYITAFAQGTVKGKILDKRTDTALEFVNIVLTKKGSTSMVQGSITDIDGAFIMKNLDNGNYTLTISYVGYKEEKRNFTISKDKNTQNFAAIYLSEDSKQIGEVTVTGQRSALKLEVDRKVFDVSQDISNAGASASEILENIPSVEVDNEGNVSLKGNTSVEVWINGKASGLTSDNRGQILEQLPGESIERIEVIDNPSAKFSAEGSAGIINIVLKKNRKAGYYGSIEAGGDTRKGANLSGNINYNSSLFDAYLNIGLRHRANENRSISDQKSFNTNRYQYSNGINSGRFNNIFTRAGITWHATKKDDITLSGMMMFGHRNNIGLTPYHFGTIGAMQDNSMMYRRSETIGDMRMQYGELSWRHNFSDRHFIDFMVGFHNWNGDNDDTFRDSTTYYTPYQATSYNSQFRPMRMKNRSIETKLDYENKISDKLTIQAGYNASFSRENTLQEAQNDNLTWEGTNMIEDKAYFNRFYYNMDTHALYLTTSYKVNQNFNIMAGLRGEYWKVFTESYDWNQEHDASLRTTPFKKDFFELFPSLFMSYQLTPTQQIQLNYTRRLRRPWSRQLNSFRDTREANMVSFGNPELTPEFSNSFSLNYLKTWENHSLLLSAYYRPTSDVIQRIMYQGDEDGVMYQTSKNLAKSTSSGVELVLKNKLFKILNLTTTANAYYYKLDGFVYNINNQTITGESNHNFTWDARIMASVILPYSITFQTTFRYNAKQLISQGYREPNYSINVSAKKDFFNKLITVSLNCRDLLNSRKFENYTNTPDFTRYQMHTHGGRRLSLTVTWNFGNMKANKPKRPAMDEEMDDRNNGDMFSIGE